MPATAAAFAGGYASSRHSLSVAPIAGRRARRRHAARRLVHARCVDPHELAAPEAVGRYAAERALSRLQSRKIKTCEVPVLFESALAAGLLGAYVQATSGGALYRKSSFLRRQPRQAGAGRRISTSTRTRTCRAARAARRSTTRASPRARAMSSSAGVVQGYFLSSYSARKLGMRTTGHAGGSHNLTLTSAACTQPGDDLDAMLRKLHRGLFVIELMGQGVNYVTGDYSRGAAGFWVESGRIAYPVHEITIAGNLRDMLEGHRRGRRRRLYDSAARRPARC